MAQLHQTSHGKENRLCLWLHKNPHAYWALTAPLLVLIYYIPEFLVTDGYWATELPIDRLIPFVPGFVIGYIAWFPCLAVVGLWLMFKDGDGFRRYMWYLILAYSISAVFYLLVPNGQDLRPVLDHPSGIFEHLIAHLYRTDTNTNVLPSLHVVGAAGCMFAVLHTKTINRRWIKALSCILTFVISISTLFVKQHAVLDVAAGALLSVILYVVVYRIIKIKPKVPLEKAAEQTGETD